MMTRLLVKITFILSAYLLPFQAYSFTLQGSRWPEPEAVFFVKIIHDDLGPGSASGISWNGAFQTAMALWQEGTVFRFLVVPNSFSTPCKNGFTADGKNGVDFRSDFCGVEFGVSTLATTINTIGIGDPDTTLESDIIFNDTKGWDVYTGPQQGSTYDFVRIAVHELGHTIGLGHEDTRPAVMKSFASNTEVPQQDDIDGVAALYGFDDIDDDGVPDDVDNCPLVSNGGQSDNDADGVGNVCDDDDDNDGMTDSFEQQHSLDRFDEKDAGEDADGDGFTNLQEFIASTDPNDSSSFPRISALPFLVPLLLDD